jgi:hypothetical protein
VAERSRLPEVSDPVFWSNRFHWCALAAGFIADAEGRIDDSRYVQQLAYELFEDGAFREHAESVLP